MWLPLVFLTARIFSVGRVYASAFEVNSGWGGLVIGVYLLHFTVYPLLVFIVLIWMVLFYITCQCLTSWPLMWRFMPEIWFLVFIFSLE